MARFTPKLSVARTKTELPPREAIHALLDGQRRLAVRVTPGAKSEGAVPVEGKLFVRVRARAVDGKANAAVCELVAKALGVPPSRVTLMRGAISREKMLQIEQ